MVNKIKDIYLKQSLIGILWMVITTILFVGVTATVRYLEGEVPAPQAAFLRYAMGTILLIPSLISLTKFKPDKPLMRKFILRGLVHSIGVTLWFYAMSVIPVAEVTAIGRPAIRVPYPNAIDDHQTANAHAMVEIGGGWLIPDEALTSERLAHRLRTLFRMPQSLQNAAEAAKKAGRAEAGSALADMILRLVPGSEDRPGWGQVT